MEAAQKVPEHLACTLESWITLLYKANKPIKTDSINKSAHVCEQQRNGCQVENHDTHTVF